MLKMNETITISPKVPDHISLDYEALRKAGMGYIERLAKSIWTDYNPHDPGITMLELLAYAITDLSHRTSFPIEDLLTDENGTLDNQFFTAKEILSCNPLTITDYRKLLIDIEGVKNAWFFVEEQAGPPIYPNCEESTLQFDPIENVTGFHPRGL